MFVLAASSRPDLIDPALLRPGRLDSPLYCGLPTEDERLEILRVLSASLRLDERADLPAAAAATQGFTGADLAAVLSEVRVRACGGRPPCGT